MPSYGASIRIDTASPLSKRALRAISIRGWYPRVGETIATVVKDNFTKKDFEAAGRVGQVGPSGYPKLGHVGLYDDMASATFWKVGASSVVISITHYAFRQRLLGGVIKPGPGKKYLTIPALKGAYGKRAGEIDGLKFGFAYDPVAGHDRPALIKGRKGKRKGNVWYWLIRQANQKPNPTVLPTDSEIVTSVKTAMREWLEDIDNG